MPSPTEPEPTPTAGVSVQTKLIVWDTPHPRVAEPRDVVMMIFVVVSGVENS